MITKQSNLIFTVSHINFTYFQVQQNFARNKFRTQRNQTTRPDYDVRM